MDGGYETKITNVSIKHTKIGIRIKYGSDNGASNADISNVNIVGNGDADSTGVLCRGSGNTLTNMRIAYVQYGVHLTGGQNTLDNIHPLYGKYRELNADNYISSIGFWEEVGGNFYDNAYSDQFATAFNICGDSSVFENCFSFWYADYGTQTGFYCTGKFNSVINSPRISFNGSGTNHVFFYTKEHGSGDIITPIFNYKKCSPSSNNYSHYIENSEIIY